MASVERQPDARLAKKPKTSSASSASRVSSGTTAAGVGGRSAAGGLRQERGDEVYWPSVGDQVEVKKDLGDDPRWGDLGSWQWCHGRSVSTSVFSRPCERALLCGSALVCLMRCVRKRHLRTCTRGCMICSNTVLCLDNASHILHDLQVHSSEQENRDVPRAHFTRCLLRRQVITQLLPPQQSCQYISASAPRRLLHLLDLSIDATFRTKTDQVVVKKGNEAWYPVKVCVFVCISVCLRVFKRIRKLYRKDGDILPPILHQLGITTTCLPCGQSMGGT